MSVAVKLSDPAATPDFMTDRKVGGRLVTCWGSSGSGKTSMSVNLSFELASLGKRVLLVDLDSYRPAIAALLGLVEAGPGITAVLRLARAGRLNLEELDRLGQEIVFGKQSLRVITGMNSPTRWPELDGAGLSELFGFARDNFDFTVIDVAGELEEGLFSQVSSVPRNFAASEALRNCDLALGLFSADQVGVNRFLVDMREAGFEFWPIANRVRASVLGRNPERQLRDTMFRKAQVKIHSTVPEDGAAMDAAQQRAQPLLLAAKSSKTREAIRLLALEVADL
jgi:hypothetical protein